jgi:chromosome partitioning protein
MTTLALYSIKGGVGKTATAVNLAYLTAQSGAKTLICDLDPQSSATYYFRVKPKLKGKARGLIKPGQAIDQSIKGTDYENLDLLPAEFNHRNLATIFDRLKRSKHRLQKILKPLQAQYDVIILDCPPNINLLAENIFNVADHILVPLIPTTLSVRTHRQLLNFFKKQNYDTRKIYAFFSMVDRRKKLHVELSGQVSQEFKRVLQSPIPYLSQIEQMGLRREPVPAFSPNSVASKSYQALWAEIQACVLSA